MVEKVKPKIVELYSSVYAIYFQEYKKQIKSFKLASSQHVNKDNFTRSGALFRCFF